MKRKSYYGAFFWLSLASFAAPLVVGIYAVQAAAPAFSKPEPKPDVSGVDNALWDYLLKQYVADGLIDYDGMKRDYLFATYIKQLGAAQPEKLANEAERLALLCNAYNALVINGVITHKIKDTVITFENQAGTGFFDIPEHIFAGETVSLNHIEHEVVRKEFQEPRIHMALVCAAKSCPVIRAEAYTGPQLEQQLEDQAIRFANNPVHVSVSEDGKTLKLSAILDWYGSDFDAQGGYLKFLAERAADPGVKAALEGAQAGTVNVAFNEYNWELNSQAAAQSGKENAPKQQFGSGSIPNE